MYFFYYNNKIGRDYQNFYKKTINNCINVTLDYIFLKKRTTGEVTIKDVLDFFAERKIKQDKTPKQDIEINKTSPSG